MPAGPLRRHRRLLVASVAAVVVLVGFAGLTALTGFPGPGPLRRYRAAELREMVDAVHEEAGPLRTPDDCWQTVTPRSPEGPRRPIATVDWVRSRVVVGMRADNVGRVDPRTRREVEARLDDVVAAHPGLDRDMVVVEASPEGWSPLMDCQLVVRGWGF